MKPRFKIGDTVLIKKDIFPRIDGPISVCKVAYGISTTLSYKLSALSISDIWYLEECLEPYVFTENKDKSLHVPGAKDDDGKPPVGLLFESFPRAFLEVAKVAGYGAKKYTRDGWKSVPDALNRYKDAADRHELYRSIDGDLDPESKCYHLAHQAWNILAVLELTLKNKE